MVGSRRHALWFVLVLSLATVIPAGPSRAAQNGVAGIQFVGTGFLGTFPCPLNTTCSGTFVGSASGALAGVNGTIPWAVTIPLGSLSASFLYNDNCGPFNVQEMEPGSGLIGFALGNGLVTANLNGAPIGTYGPDPNGPIKTPAPVVAIEAPFSFSWTRVAANAVMNMSGSARIQVLQAGGPVWIDVAVNQPGHGTAAFVPTTGEMIPTCDAPDALTALVVGGSLFSSVA